MSPPNENLTTLTSECFIQLESNNSIIIGLISLAPAKALHLLMKALD